MNNKLIIVDKNGKGDYTSFTRAIKENLDNGIKIKVMPGIYDIIEEYEAIWGKNAVATMSDKDAAIFQGFEYGIILRNKKIDFMPGSHLICNWNSPADATHRFSALRVEYNCKIIGLDLEVTGTMYAIHDDYGLAAEPYTNEYKNCRVIGHALWNANCIGGGCQKYSRHIIDNCYFDNGFSNSGTVRYHNTFVEGAEPVIYVSNSYFNSQFMARWYGLQQSKMRVYVNNCEAEAIYKTAEAASVYNVDNVELYKWNNNERK